MTCGTAEECSLSRSTSLCAQMPASLAWVPALHREASAACSKVGGAPFRVDYGRIVQPRAASKHARGKRRRGQVAEPPPGQAQAPPAELFHPVECELCGTHLGEAHALV